MGFDQFFEEVQVLGRDLVEKVKELLHEGNVNRIIIKDQEGRTYVEIPVNVGLVGAIVAPVLAAVGAIAALAAKFKIVVERSPAAGPAHPEEAAKEAAPKAAEGPPSPAPDESNPSTWQPPSADVW